MNFRMLIIKFAKLLNRQGFNNKKSRSQKSKKYGVQPIINLEHSDISYEAVTQRDKKEAFPYFKNLLNRKDNFELDLDHGTDKFTSDIASILDGRAIGIDISKELNESAPELNKVKFKFMKEGVIPLSDNSIDVVWLYGASDCLSEDILDKAVTEINRILKPGGLLFLTKNTTEATAKDYYHYRQVKEYQKKFNQLIEIEHIRDFFDIGKNFQERFSIMSGRKVTVN